MTPTMLATRLVQFAKGGTRVAHVKLSQQFPAVFVGYLAQSNLREAFTAPIGLCNWAKCGLVRGPDDDGQPIQLSTYMKGVSGWVVGGLGSDGDAPPPRARRHELNCTRFARHAEHGEVPLVKRGVLLPPNTATHIMECCGKRFQRLDTSSPCQQCATMLHFANRELPIRDSTFSSRTGGLHIRAPRKKGCVTQNTSCPIG